MGIVDNRGNENNTASFARWILGYACIDNWKICAIFCQVNGVDTDVSKIFVDETIICWAKLCNVKYNRSIASDGCEIPWYNVLSERILDDVEDIISVGSITLYV